MLAEHIDVNIAILPYGFTPLHMAVGLGPTENIAKLLELGADVNLGASTQLRIPDQKGMTPFHFASIKGKVQNMALLLEAGADIELKDGGTGSTALIAAAHGRRADGIEFLIKAGANLHATDIRGRTALHQAVIVGVAEPVDILLDAGADPFATDKDDNIPFDYARGNSDWIKHLSTYKRLKAASGE